MKPLTITLKVANNLHIVGDRVISYETHVATIERKPSCLQRRPVIRTNGKYSRTTGKHVSLVAELLGASIDRDPKRQDFWQFEYGVRCSLPDSLSPAGSALVLRAMARGLDHEAALAAAVTGMSKRDLKIVNEIAADLPELQTRIKRAVFLSALGLV